MSKASKRRACPAVQREISTAECGENRGSRYSCPPECGFSPFAPANYTQFLELEKFLDDQTIGWLGSESADRNALRNDLHRAQAGGSAFALHATLVWKIYFARDAQGRTCMQRWEAAGFPGLKNDHRTLARARMGIRVVPFEVRRVLDDTRTEVVDLLATEPEAFIVFDRGLASSVARFSTGITWMFVMPHFQRLFGLSCELPEVDALDPREVVDEVVRHLGGPTDEAGMRLWLAEHFLRVEAALNAVILERRRLMFANIDGKFGKAVYQLNAPFAECCDKLDEVAEVGDDELQEGEAREGFAAARAWLGTEDDPSMNLAAEAGAPVLGRVLLGQSHWRLETIGAAKLRTLRSRFEKQMGARVKFTGERLDDLAQRVAAGSEKVDVALVPPRLLENLPMLHVSTSRMPMPAKGETLEEVEAELLAEQDRIFLDDSVPALDGRTPREAARDPLLRPKLIRLMKSRIRSTDERNLKTGANHDVNWMLRELGLNEIIFDPPPAGRVARRLPDEFVETDEDKTDFDDSEDDALPMDSDLPPAPRLPDRPFTFEEVQHRMVNGLESFKSPLDGLNEMQVNGCTLLDDVYEVTEGLVDEDAFSSLVPVLTTIWYIFVPPGTRGPNLTRASLREEIETELRKLADALKVDHPDALMRYLEGGPQPNVVKFVFAWLLAGLRGTPKKERITENTQTLFAAIIRAVVAELDRTHRELQ